jgi:hypothetical protein
MNRNKKNVKRTIKEDKSKSNRNSQGKGDAMKDMDQDDPKFRKLNKYNDGNDPDYYFTSTDLAEQAATFPFPYFLGTRPTVGNVNIPTVQVMFFNPSVGVTNYVGGKHELQTGTNMAAQKLYTRLSVASGRTANYQPNDVIMGVQAIISLAEAI